MSVFSDKMLRRLKRYATLRAVRAFPPLVHDEPHERQRRTTMSVDIAETAAGRTLAGECLCGDVQYRVEDCFQYALNCHCSQCRRATGSAFKPFGGIERSRFSLVKGAHALTLFGDEQGHDAHCKRCGSLLYSVVREGQYVHVTLGTLRDAPSLLPTAHIFVGSKAPWYTITDDLPQHLALPAPAR
jgi:hypothetical protein